MEAKKTILSGAAVFFPDKHVRREKLFHMMVSIESFHVASLCALNRVMSCSDVIRLYRKISHRISLSRSKWHLNPYAITSGEYTCMDNTQKCPHIQMQMNQIFIYLFIFMCAVIRIQVASCCSRLKELLQTLRSPPYWPSWRRCCWWQQEKWETSSDFHAQGKAFVYTASISFSAVRGLDGGWERRSEQDSAVVLVLGAAGQPPHLVLPAAQSWIHLCCQCGAGRRSISKMWDTGLFCMTQKTFCTFVFVYIAT